VEKFILQQQDVDAPPFGWRNYQEDSTQLGAKQIEWLIRIVPVELIGLVASTAGGLKEDPVTRCHSLCTSKSGEILAYPCRFSEAKKS